MILIKDLEIGDLLIKGGVIILEITELTDEFMIEEEVHDLISNTFGVEIYRKIE